MRKYKTITHNDCLTTFMGQINGAPVIVATDFLGSQIIVGGSEHKTHLLSPPYTSHAHAVKNAARIIKHGSQYRNWQNFRLDSVGTQAFNFMTALIAGGSHG
jgi:hypothetical protein